jgi:hypothetical protein
MTKHHRMSGLSNRNLISTVLAPGSLGSKGWQHVFLLKPLSLACRKEEIAIYLSVRCPDILFLLGYQT